MREGMDMPCCNDLLELMMIQVLGVFAKHDIIAMPTMGSLLSTIRDQHINPWTADVDVIALQYSRTWEPRVMADLNKLGLIYFEWGWGRVCFHLNHPGLNEVAVHQNLGNAPRMDSLSVMMDVWRAFTDPVTMTVFGEGFDGCLFNMTDIFPLRDCVIGHEHKWVIKCPRDAEKFLKLKFGNWQTPVKAKHGNFVCGGSKWTPSDLAKRFDKEHARVKVIPELFDGLGWHEWYECVNPRDDSERRKLENVWYKD